MENTSKSTILAINPGTRYIGIAVFNGTDLVDWGVKVIEGKWSPKKLTKAVAAISTLTMDYRPSVIVVKRLHPSRTSSQLDELCREIRGMADKHHAEVQDYSIEEIEAFHGQGTSEQLAEMVSVKYPALIPTLHREQRSNTPYHVRMFEAVALGIVCVHDHCHQARTNCAETVK